MVAQQSLLAARLRITVAPDAKVQACDIEQSSGDARFDARLCEITMKRARFRAGAMPDGTPAYGVFRVPVAFTAVRPGWYPRVPEALKPAADLELTVDRLPKGKPSPFQLDLAFAVEADGRLSSCRAQRNKQDPDLVAMACREISAQFKAIPATGPEGTPVPSVQNGRVFFTRRQAK